MDFNTESPKEQNIADLHAQINDLRMEIDVLKETLNIL